jgi:hypothetical protein
MDPSPQTPPTLPRAPMGQSFTAARQGSTSGGFRPTPVRSRSMLDVLATILFFIALLAWLGFYGYSFLLQREIKTIAQSIDAIAQSFNPATIDSLEALGNRLAHAKQIINDHTALTPLFCFIESNTLTKNIEFSAFSYSRSGEGLGNQSGGQPIKVSNAVRLSGRAGSFQSLAYQAKVLQDSNKLSALTFDGLAVNPADGKVNFQATFGINRDVLAYQPNMSVGCNIVPATSGTTTTNL